MTTIIEGILSFFACLFFAIIYNTPKKEVIRCGIAGGIGYAMYHFTVEYSSLTLMGTFLGTIVISLLSKFFSFKYKMPVMLYILPAIFTLVPGAGIYYCMHGILNDNLVFAVKNGIDAFKTLGVIVIAMMLIIPLPINFQKFKK